MFLRMHDLSRQERQRRAKYYFLRGNLDYMLINATLIESLFKYRQTNTEYPFPDLQGLKPPAKSYDLPEDEFAAIHSSGLALFFEGTLDRTDKKYIKFKKNTQATKENILDTNILVEDVRHEFKEEHTRLTHPNFESLLKQLLKIDYAILIQSTQSENDLGQYRLTDYRVKMDLPVEDAARDLAKQLGYITEITNEQTIEDDDLLEQIEEKLYEYYAFHNTVGGRRTGAIQAAQYLKRTGLAYTIYAGSATARTLTRITEKNVKVYSLIKIRPDSIQKIKQREPDFLTDYVIDDDVCIFRTVYSQTPFSTPGCFKKLDPTKNWLTIIDEAILPKQDKIFKRPLSYKVLRE